MSPLCPSPPRASVTGFNLSKQSPSFRVTCWVGSSPFSLITCLLSYSRMDTHKLSLPIPPAKNEVLSWVSIVI